MLQVRGRTLVYVRVRVRFVCNFVFIYPIYNHRLINHYSTNFVIGLLYIYSRWFRLCEVTIILRDDSTSLVVKNESDSHDYVFKKWKTLWGIQGWGRIDGGNGWSRRYREWQSHHLWFFSRLPDIQLRSLKTRNELSNVYSTQQYSRLLQFYWHLTTEGEIEIYQ